MKCTNCGNDNPATLWDEGDTIYCSVCTHRTRKTDFEDDSVQCPYCHRLRDKKAMYCRYCNSSDWTPSSPAEFAEIDQIVALLQKHWDLRRSEANKFIEEAENTSSCS